MPTPKVDESKGAAAAPEEPVQAEEGTEEDAAAAVKAQAAASKVGGDGYEWVWKKELETSRRTFFL